VDKKKQKEQKDTYKMPFTSLTINNINRFATEEYKRSVGGENDNVN